MPHQLELKYLSSKANFVFNQMLFRHTFQRERERSGCYDTFKLLLKIPLKELFANKGEILSCKSVKPCKNRKNSRAYYTRTRLINPVQIPHPFKVPPSPGTMHSQMPGVFRGGMLKLQFDRYIMPPFLHSVVLLHVLT